MKLRNFLIVLFAILMVFAFASCKNEPKEEPKPTPKPQPVIPDYYQIEVTEGVDKDYWNRDKIKIEWEEEVNAGDVVSLKYRSERDVYQWDIRDGSLKWVYETKKGSFTDPVLGEDGWWTLTYTFANDINGAAVDSNERFGIYFRGNYVTTDLFEIKDITLNGEPLEITQDNIKSYAVLNDTEDHPLVEHDWSKKNWSVLFATGTVGEVDKTPLAEKVLDGGYVTGAPVNKEGYTLSIFTDADRTTPFDATQPITENKIFYYSYVGVPRALTFVLNGGAFEEGAEVPATVPNGDMLPEIPEPVLATKAFKAWYKDAELTTPWEATDTVTGDLTLYAAYGEPRTVTFDAQNGEAEHATKIVADGNTVKIPEAPENGSKMFLGWYADAEGTTLYDFSTPVTADITIYAAWASTTDVTLNLNYEGAPAATSFKAALDVVLAADDENLAVKRDGYVLDGWYDEATLETEHDFTVAVTGSFTLYAKWAPIPLVKLTASKGVNDGIYDYDKFEIHFDRKVNENDVLTIVYRSTRAIDSYNIRTVRNNLNPPDIRWVYEGKTGMTISEPDADGWVTVSYTFGLTVDRGYNPSTGKSDKTVKAITSADYDVVNNIDFHFRGSIVPGDYLEIKEMRWNDEIVTDMLTVAKAALGHSGDVVINAENVVEIAAADSTWTGAKTYPVFFYADPTEDDGTNYSGEELTGLGFAVEENALVTKPAEDPTREGYVFEGWSTAKDGSEPWDFANDKVTGKTRLYAIWRDPVAEPVYRLVATAASDRFQFKWDDQAVAAGDVITFKYQSEKAITSHTTRTIDPSTKLVDGEALAGEPAGGWYTFSFTIPEGKSGTGLGIALFVEGGAAIDDALRIKDITYNETPLTLVQANAWAGCSPTITAE